MNNENAAAVDGLVKTALDTLGVPVERVKFSGVADTFIVFQLISGREVEHSDDDGTAYLHTYGAEFFSKSNYMPLLKQARAALKAAGFYGITTSAEFYESATDFYRVSLDFNYLEVGYEDRT